MNPLVITFSSEYLETIWPHTDIKLVTVYHVSLFEIQNTSFLLKVFWFL